MAGRDNKMKILYLMKILLERTDENHVMTAQDLIMELGRYGLSAERKSIYSDIETLKEFGLDIIQLKGKVQGYYIGQRTFELSELKLLVDAVQSSKFITIKKSEELIKKLEKLTSSFEAQQLQRHVFIYNRPKAGNEEIYYNVDQIHTAILQNMQIRFQYVEWNVKKELQMRKNGTYYVVSPWILTWENENYYLIGYEDGKDAIKHYRVDRMLHTSIVEKARLGERRFRDFELTSFMKKTFAMYGGDDARVTFECDNKLAGAIMDRFGRDIIMIPSGDHKFRVSVTITLSPPFFGWVTGMGKLMRIVSPEYVKSEYRKYMQEILSEMYEE